MTERNRIKIALRQARDAHSAGVRTACHARITGGVEANRLGGHAGLWVNAERVRRSGGVLRVGNRGHIQGLANIRLNIEIKIDSNALKECIVERDEPHFDRYLQIL